MCGRYTVTNPDELYERFDIKNRVELTPRYNAAPSQELPVIDQPHHVELMEWGLIPHWAKEGKVGYSMINARVEGIEKKPSYKKPLLYQRCIVPADGFFEWKQTRAGKVPYYFRLKDGEMFGFAGLYDVWTDKNGRELKTFTIITGVPNEIVSEVHNRMPVILKEEDERTWLNPDIVEPERLLNLLRPYPDNEMEDYIVSKAVNSPAHDDPDVISPQESPYIPPI